MRAALGAIVVVILALACGSLSDFKSDSKDNKGTDTATSTSTGDVEFSGYVQKAFVLKVNAVEFADSENFYTRFIEELVKPKYPDIAEADVKLEGQYGLEEFGANSKVFMSSMAADGHLFEARTDQQSKFTVKVKSSALDETFKARVIIRIGLSIKNNDEELRYCYILHGTKEGIAVSESAKPIIFDDFSTQLNTYKCEDVREDELVIPGASTAGVLTPSGGDGVNCLRAGLVFAAALSGCGGESGSETKSEPAVKVAGSTAVASPLRASETGANELAAMAYSPADSRFYVSKQRVIDSESGKTVAAIERMNPTVDTEAERLFSVEAPKLTSYGEVRAIAPIGTGVLGFIEPWYLNHYAIADGAEEQLVSVHSDATADQLAAFKNNATGSGTTTLFLHDDSVKAYGGSTHSLCNIDPTSSAVVSGCKEYQMASIGCRITTDGGPGVVSATSYRGLIAIQIRDRSSPSDTDYCPASIILVNENNVAQKRYTVPKLVIGSDEFESGKLVSDGETLYFVTMKDNAIVFRKLELTE
jgi:hypothetical protein